MVAECEVHGWRQGGLVGSHTRHAVVHRHEAVRVGKGKGLQDYPVHHTEYGGRAPDTETKSEDGNRCEDGASPETPECVACVGPQVLDQADSPSLPGALLVAEHRAEVTPGLAPGLLLCHPSLHELPGLHLDVKCHLVVQLPLHLPRDQSGPEAERQIRYPAHGIAPRVAIAA